MNASDQIVVSELELSCRIGVPDEERAQPQRLTLSLCLTPRRSFEGLGDDLTNTVDYFALTRRLRLLAAERPRRLIETLGVELAECVLGEFPVARVDLELRKYILPDTEYVAVRISRGVSEGEMK
ncbi:MAG: hypothetical protein RLZZ244_3198 [Verrucomicrobiota bacterium]